MKIATIVYVAISIAIIWFGIKVVMLLVSIIAGIVVRIGEAIRRITPGRKKREGDREQQ